MKKGGLSWCLKAACYNSNLCCAPILGPKLRSYLGGLGSSNIHGFPLLPICSAHMYTSHAFIFLGVGEQLLRFEPLLNLASFPLSLNPRHPKALHTKVSLVPDCARACVHIYILCMEPSVLLKPSIDLPPLQAALAVAAAVPAG